MVLELLAPICEKKQHPQLWLFSTRSVLPCSRWACRQTLHQSFPSPVWLSLSLTDTGILLVPPGSTTKAGWRRTRGRPDGIPDWLSSIPPRPWCDLPSSLMPPRVEQGSFPRIFAKLGLLGKHPSFYASAHSWVQSWPLKKQRVIKGQTTTKMSLLSVTTPGHRTAKEVVEGWPARKGWFSSSCY